MPIPNSFVEHLSDTIVVELKRGISESSHYSLESALRVFRDQVNVVDARSTYDTIATVVDKRTTAKAVAEGAGRGNVYTVYSDVMVAKGSLENWFELTVDQVAEDAKPEVVSEVVKAKILSDIGTVIQEKLTAGDLVSSSTTTSIINTNVADKVASGALVSSSTLPAKVDDEINVKIDDDTLVAKSEVSVIASTAIQAKLDDDTLVSKSDVPTITNTAIQAKIDDGSISKGGLDTILSDMTVSAPTLSNESGKLRSTITVSNKDNSQANITVISPILTVSGNAVYLEVSTDSTHGTVNTTTGKEVTSILLAGTPIIDNTTGKMVTVSVTLPQPSNLLPDPVSTTYNPDGRKLSFLFDSTFPVPDTGFGCELIVYKATGEFVVSKIATISKPDVNSTVLEFILDATSADVSSSANTPSKANLRLTAESDSLWWSEAKPVNSFNPTIIGTELGSSSELLVDGVTSSTIGSTLKFSVINPKLCSANSVVEVVFTDSSAGVWSNVSVPLATESTTTNGYVIPDLYEDTYGTLSVTYNGEFSSSTTKTEPFVVLSNFRAISADDKALFKPVLSNVATSNSASSNYGFKLIQGELTKSTNATITECTINGVDVLADCVLTKDSATSGVWYVDMNGTVLTASGSNTVTIKVVDTDDNTISIFDATSGASTTSLVLNTDAGVNVTSISVTN